MPSCSSSTARNVEAKPGETIWQVAQRLGTEIPHLCYLPEPGYRPDGNCRVCMVEIEGERVLAASCMRKPAAGMKVKTATERAEKARNMVMELLVADQPARETSHDPTSKLWTWADKTGVTTSRFPAAERWAARSEPCRHARQSRCLHPMRALRARLPRGAGQRCDRHGLSQRGRQDRLRLRRPDGRIDLRRLRGVRASLPDRRLDAVGLPRRERDARRLARSQGRFALPLLRRRLPGDLQRQGREDRLCGRPQRAREREPALRQRPLRLRLYPPRSPA